MKTVRTLKEGYATKFASKIGRFGFSRFKIIHKKTGKLVGVLSIDRASGDHHFHLANGKGYTLPKDHEDISSSNILATTNKFMKNLGSGKYDKVKPLTFGPNDWHK